MKKITLFLCCSLIVFLSSSCTTTHIIPLANAPQTNVILKENNYRILKKVTGEWSATYVLGLGGTSRETLANNSLAKMIENAQLKDNQAIINTTTAASTTYIFFPLYAEVTSVSTGYVIEFIGHSSNNQSSSISTTENKISNTEKEKSPTNTQSNEQNQPHSTAAPISSTTDSGIRPLQNRLPETISSVYESFRSGTVHNMSKKKRTNTENEFIAEIEKDLKEATTMNDLDIVNMKIGYLHQYSLLHNEVNAQVNRLKKALTDRAQEMK